MKFWIKLLFFEYIPASLLSMRGCLVLILLSILTLLAAWIPYVGNALSVLLVAVFCGHFIARFPLEAFRLDIPAENRNVYVYSRIFATTLGGIAIAILVLTSVPTYWGRILGVFVGALTGMMISGIVDWVFSVIFRPSRTYVAPPVLTVGVHDNTYGLPLKKNTLKEIRDLERIIPSEYQKGIRDDLDTIDCTVFSPPAAAKEDSLFVQVFVHKLEEAILAFEIAKEFDTDAERRAVKSLATQILHGARLTFHLTMPTLRVDDPVQSLIWRGRPESVQFEVKIPSDHAGGTVIGTVTISENMIPVGHIKFKITVGYSLSISRPIGDESKQYNLVFISYASQDRPKVISRVQILRTLGINFFQDILNLDPGDRWEKELYKHIDECDLFLLFWSKAAKESTWVRKETQYALKRKGGDDLAPPDIKPVIIEGPPVVLPWEELSHLHFDDFLTRVFVEI